MTLRRRIRMAVPLLAGTVTIVASASGLAAVDASGKTTAKSPSADAAGPGGAPPGSGGQTSSYTDKGAYTLAKGTALLATRTLTARSGDESGVLVSGGTLRLSDPTVVTSGASQSSDASSFYGLDAGILAESGGAIEIRGGSVTTTGDGANGIFAYGSSSRITVSSTKVRATGSYAHGIMASGGGTITATDLVISTAGQSSAAVATDRGGGTITVIGGEMTTSGFKSPGIYSTGQITVRDATMTATGAEAAVVEGGNSITAIDSTLHGTVEHGVMLYNSMSGDAQTGTGRYTMVGGTLTAAAGPAFYVTNTRALITLEDGASVKAASGVLLRADNAGTGSGNTGAGIATLILSDERVTGEVISAGTGTISAHVQDHSVLTGRIATAALTLDATSRWVVTGDSTLSSLSDAAAVSGDEITNIVGNGHTVTYVASLNSWLGGKTYKLAGGGTLKPS